MASLSMTLYFSIFILIKFVISIILHYIDEASKNMMYKESLEGQEESILRKFLKINKKAAVAMVSDFLLAGVDTVKNLNYNFKDFQTPVYF